MGAPRKYPPKNAAALIEELATQGHAIIGIAKKLGVGREAFKRWCEEDEVLQEAFEVGRDAHRQALVALLMQAAVANKGTNANAMFLLKTMHGFRETDSSNTNIKVGVAVVPSVMVVRDHGTDEEWEARTAEQQRALVLDAASPPKVIEADVPAPPSYAPLVPASHPAPPLPQYTDAPAWKGNA
ncbi:hypothetical protein [Tunturiibacter psychrotolerans]|uniref:hypothetical protein n=1 Tax=Tunturiibacter psychrotolerans TaxID=3069686 RepID=UPI003D209EA7